MGRRKEEDRARRTSLREGEEEILDDLNLTSCRLWDLLVGEEQMEMGKELFGGKREILRVAKWMRLGISIC